MGLIKGIGGNNTANTSGLAGNGYGVEADGAITGTLTNNASGTHHGDGRTMVRRMRRDKVVTAYGSISRTRRSQQCSSQHCHNVNNNGDYYREQVEAAGLGGTGNGVFANHLHCQYFDQQPKTITGIGGTAGNVTGGSGYGVQTGDASGAVGSITTLTNSGGTITGTRGAGSTTNGLGFGVVSGTIATLLNNATGTIKGDDYGIYLGLTGTGPTPTTDASAVSITNNGTLTGGTTHGTQAALVSGAGIVTLNLGGGGSVTGDIVGGIGIPNIINVNGAHTITGDITDYPTLNINAGGALILNGNNATVAAVTINGTGSLQLGNGTLNGTLAAAATVANSGQLIFNEGTTQQIFANTIIGSGSVVQNGPLAVIVTGANTYMGTTTINAGVLAAGSTTGFSANSAYNLITGTSYLDLNGFNSSIGSLAGPGPVTNGSGFVTGPTIGDATLTTGSNNNSTTHTGTISDGASGKLSLTKVGTGTQTLSGANAYSGATTVNGGSLLVNGTNSGTGAVTVNNSGSTLGGNGAIAGAVTLGASTFIAPGSVANTVGTLTLTGGLTFNANSTYAVDLGAGANNADKLVITGATALTGNITFNQLTTPDQGKYVLLTSTGALTGTFTGTAPTNYNLIYDTVNNEVDLTHQAVPSITLTAPAGGTRVILGQTLSAGGAVSNTAPTGSLNLNINLTSTGAVSLTGFSPNTGTVAVGTPVNYTATLNTTGLTAGNNTFTVTETDNVNAASNPTATASVTVAVVTDRTLAATSVSLGRVIINQATGSQTTTVSSAINMDNSLTRVTLGAGAANSAVANGTITLGAGTAYQFGGANDATNSTTRGVTGSFTAAGLQGGSATFTPTGEGLAGESVQSFTVGYTADAVNNRIVTATSVSFGRVIANVAQSATSTLSTTGADTDFTRVTVGQRAADANGISATGGTNPTFNAAGVTDTRTVGGSFTSTGAKSGTLTLVTTGEGLAGEAPINVSVAYTATALTNRVVTATSVNYGTVHVGSTAPSTSSTTLTSAGSDTTNTRITVGNGGTDSNSLGFTVSGGSPSSAFNGTFISDTRTLGGGTFSTAGSINGTVTLTNAGAEGAGNSTLAGQTPGSTVVAYNAQVFNGTAVWTSISGTGTSSWGTASNWTDSNGVHASPGTFAGFTNTDTATFNGTGTTATVNLDGVNPSLKAIVFSGISSYTVAQGSGGSLTLDNGAIAATVTNAGTNTISAPVILNSNVAVSVTNSGDSLTLSGVLSEAGGAKSLTKSGGGVLNLAGANTYSGTTTISGGTLALTGNGSIDKSTIITLASTGMLDVSGRTGGGYTFGNTTTGSGKIVGNFTNAGIIIPGSLGAANNLIGNLTVSGSFTQTASGTLVTAVHADSSTNVLVVTGTANLGGTLELKPDSGSLGAGKYLIVQAGSVVGLFSSVKVDGGTFTPFQDLEGNLLYITATPVTNGTTHLWAPIPGMSGNGLKVAQYFDAIRAGATGQLASLIAQVDAGSNAQIIRFVNSVDPSVYAEQRQMQLRDMQNQANFLTERLTFLRGPVAQGDSAQGDGSGKAPRPPVAVTEERFNLWTSIRGSVLDNSGSSNFVGANNDGVGGIVGLDYKATDLLTLGGFIGYEGNLIKLAGNSGSLRSEYLTLGAYGTIGHDTGWYGNGLAEVGFGWNSDKKNLLLPNQILTARSDFNSTAWLVRAGGGYALTAGGWHFGPAAYAEYSGLKQDAIHEHGTNGLDLDVNGKTLQSFRTLLGLNANGDMPVGDRKLRSRFGVYWAHEFLKGNNDVAAGLDGVNAGTFTVNGPRLGRNSLIATTGASIDLTKTMDLSLDYQYQRDFGTSHGNSHYFGITLGMKF